MNNMLRMENRSLIEFFNIENLNLKENVEFNDLSHQSFLSVGLEMYSKLNTEQRLIVDTILNLTNNYKQTNNLNN